MRNANKNPNKLPAMLVKPHVCGTNYPILLQNSFKMQSVPIAHYCLHVIYSLCYVPTFQVALLMYTCNLLSFGYVKALPRALNALLAMRNCDECFILHKA